MFLSKFILFLFCHFIKAPPKTELNQPSFNSDYTLLQATCRQHCDLLNQLNNNLAKGEVIGFIVDFPALSIELNHIMNNHLKSSHPISLLCYSAAFRVNKVISNIFSKKLILEGNGEKLNYENLFDEDVKQYFGIKK